MAHSGGRLGGEGRGYLQGRRALPRGRPRPTLQLCPARKRRPSARPGPGLASAPPPHRGRQSPTSSPFSPLDPARPGRPCRAEGRGQSHRIHGEHPQRARGAGSCPGTGAQAPLRDPQEKPCPGSSQRPSSRGPCGARHSPAARWAPSLLGRRCDQRHPAGDSGLMRGRTPRRPSPAAGRPRHTYLLTIESRHPVPAVPARHALGTGDGDSMRPEGGPLPPCAITLQAAPFPVSLSGSHGSAATGGLCALGPRRRGGERAP